MMQMNNGFNPMAQLMQRINMATQTSAQARQTVQMIRSKSPEEKKRFVESMCRERNITPEDLARSLGIQIPSNR